MPRASATTLVMFLATLHVLFYFAGVEGVRPLQSGNNPHQAFYENASGGQFQDAVSAENETGILPSEFRVGLRSIEGLNVLSGIMTSPYDAIGSTRIPDPFNTLGSVLLGFLEAYAVLLLFRGVSG